MKTPIILSGVKTSSKLYLHTMNEATKRADDTDNDAEDKETQAYKWTIETELGNFTGTCLSIDNVNEEIAVLTNNTKILKKNITPITLMKENLGDKVYTWDVVTHSGQASGVSVSLEEAKKVINSFGSKEVVKSNIIESAATLK